MKPRRAARAAHGPAGEHDDGNEAARHGHHGRDRHLDPGRHRPGPRRARRRGRDPGAQSPATVAHDRGRPRLGGGLPVGADPARVADGPAGPDPADVGPARGRPAAVLRPARRRAGREHRGRRPVAPRHLPAGADRDPLDDVMGIDAGQGRRRAIAEPLPRAQDVRASRWEAHPRRGLLFEGLPGTGKTHLAKAMAREAGVPFLFVSATSFQSMYYGATARKIRSYFKALRKAARQEGGAIGFIEEIDAIAIGPWRHAGHRAARRRRAPPADAVRRSRDGLPSSYAVRPRRRSTPVDDQRRRRRRRQRAARADAVLRRAHRHASSCTAWLDRSAEPAAPVNRQLKRPVPPPTNVLVIAATNRADNLDPALLRPGRFDRRLTFEVPGRSGRRELVDHFLAPQGPCPRARRRGVARPARRGHPGLHAGDDRAPLRRGARQRGAPRRRGP